MRRADDDQVGLELVGDAVQPSSGGGLGGRDGPGGDAGLGELAFEQRSGLLVGQRFVSVRSPRSGNGS